MSDGRNYTDEDYRQLHSAHCVTEAQRAAAVKEIERLREDWFQREKVLKDPVAVHINMLRGGGVRMTAGAGRPRVKPRTRKPMRL